MLKRGGMQIDISRNTSLPSRFVRKGGYEYGPSIHGQDQAPTFSPTVEPASGQGAEGDGCTDTQSSRSSHFTCRVRTAPSCQQSGGSGRPTNQLTIRW